MQTGTNVLVLRDNTQSSSVGWMSYASREEILWSWRRTEQLGGGAGVMKTKYDFITYYVSPPLHLDSSTPHCTPSNVSRLA